MRINMAFFKGLLIFISTLIVSPASIAAINTNNLGAKYDATQSNITFRIYSSRATRLELNLFAAPSGAAERLRYTLTKNATTNIWSVTVPVSTIKGAGINGTVYYGYRAWGPNWPYVSTWTKGSATGFISDVDSSGNRFNPNKLLLDPYSLEISHDPVNINSPDGTIYASGALNRNRDTGLLGTKGMVLLPDTTSIGTKPTRALKDDIFYEVHVRGLTQTDTSIPAAYRGTYKGAALKAGYLASLGVTAVEFLPIQETQNDNNDLDPNSNNGDNYWGYLTLNYFAPDRRFSSDKTPGGPTREFKAMVKAFHDVGIKVFLDVVYNHTGEGGAYNSADTTTYNLYSWRGLDNPAYYSLTTDLKSSYDNTGVGGNYNTYRPIAQDLIIDSLAYYRDKMGVDGFRFDLASVLGNTCEVGCFNFDKNNPNTALARITRELPPRPDNGGVGVDLVAEPYAIGGNSFQMGGYPVGWSEWNVFYRDLIRQSQNKLNVVPVTTGQIITRMAGSSDLFGDDGRKPWNSINFLNVHDGFTLKDIYTCNDKFNNQAYPFGPSDGGHDDNIGWDQGGIVGDQRKAARNGLAINLLSAGTPLIVGGDEYLRSLNCNNNPYNLDTVANWLNYNWTPDQTNFNAFAKGMIAFRKAHPSLRPLNFYSGVDNNGNVMEQIRFFKPDGGVADAAYFNNTSNHAIAYRIDGSEFGDSASAIYVAYNAWSANVNFVLPWPGTGKNWYRVTDTCPFAEGPNQVRTPGAEDFIGGEYTNYGVCGRGVLVLIAK